MQKIEKIKKFYRNGKARWVCKCHCGREWDILEPNIKKTKSCGCLKIKWTPDKNKKLLELSENNVHYKQIAKILDMKENSIHSQLKRLGYSKGHYRKWNYNRNFFNTWSNDMAYILGFLMSDGYVGHKHSG